MHGYSPPLLKLLPPHNGARINVRIDKTRLSLKICQSHDVLNSERLELGNSRNPAIGLRRNNLWSLNPDSGYR